GSDLRVLYRLFNVPGTSRDNLHFRSEVLRIFLHQAPARLVRALTPVQGSGAAGCAKNVGGNKIVGRDRCVGHKAFLPNADPRPRLTRGGVFKFHDQKMSIASFVEARDAALFFKAHTGPSEGFVLFDNNECSLNLVFIRRFADQFKLARLSPRAKVDHSHHSGPTVDEKTERDIPAHDLNFFLKRIGARRPSADTLLGVIISKRSLSTHEPSSPPDYSRTQRKVRPGFPRTRRPT